MAVMAAIFLLAWWPWNFWLIFFVGAAYAGKSQRAACWRLIGSDAHQTSIEGPQGVEHLLTALNELQPPNKASRVVGSQKLSNTMRKV